MFVRFLCAEAGNSADGFDGGDAFLDAGAVYFEDLCSERKVDTCGGGALSEVNDMIFFE